MNIHNKFKRPRIIFLTNDIGMDIYDNNPKRRYIIDNKDIQL